MEGDITGSHWNSVEELLPLYRAITTCEVFDGTSTNFWHDQWLSEGRMRDVFPLLYTHATKTVVSVRDIVQHGIERHLVPRISRAAKEELTKMNTLLARVSLRDGADRRLCALADKDGALRSGKVYSKLMAISGAPACFATFERIQCRSNLKKKHILPDDACAICGNHEDCNHIMFSCPFSSQAWSSLGVDV
nr:unnamed protein product [Digitaria exilis]